MQQEIRDTSYLDLETIAEWLEIKAEKVGLVGDTKALKTVQDLKFTAKVPGGSGDLVSIEYGASGSLGAESVSTIGKAIKVEIASGVSTASQIQTAIEAHPTASDLVTVTVTGVGSNPQVSQAKTYLAGGVWPASYEPATVNRLNTLINAACGAVERYIGCPVLAREFQADYDGQLTNVISPRHWPVRQILELKIDYGRTFDDSSIMDPSNYFLRGEEDFSKRGLTGSSPTINLVGADVVLVDEDQKFVLGRMTTGGVLGSIRLKYKAGWAMTQDEIPDDILQATRMLLEYWFFKRQNRDLNMAAKGVQGQSYTVVAQGLPKDVKDILDPYIDVSLGEMSVIQNNQ